MDATLMTEQEAPRNRRRALSAATAILGLVAGFANAPAAVADPTDPARRLVPDLAQACNPETMQALASKLPVRATVREIPNARKLAGGVRYVAATGDLPAFCQVTGRFVTNPRTGRTANFLATFPAAWNGKYIQLGCGGTCGTLAGGNDPARPESVDTNQGRPGQIIAKGYAAFATDEGHETPHLKDWATTQPGQVDRDAIEDFYYRANKVLTQFGKAFTTSFYSGVTRTQQSIEWSYYSGCSGGGRDAMVAASFFPDEFDGIVAGSPAGDLTGLSFQLAALSAASARSADADVPATLMKLIDPIVKARCDALDGVKDDLIQNPAACDFHPDRDLPQCNETTARTQCFTKAQIETLSVLLTAVTDEDGGLVQPAFAVGELAGRGGTAASLAGGVEGAELAEPALRILVHRNDPTFEARSLFRWGVAGPISGFRAVVPKTEVSMARSAFRPGSGFATEDISELIRLKRKLLIWHNLSDQSLTPYRSINYYKTLARAYGGYGKLQENIRLFTIPGSGHCSGTGVGPNNFDALSAIEAWTERGVAPDALVAKLYDPDRPAVDQGRVPIRSMPLCKFPEMARFSGRGDLNDAAGWSCPKDDKSMLQVGESGRRAGVLE